MELVPEKENSSPIAVRVNLSKPSLGQKALSFFEATPPSFLGLKEQPNKENRWVMVQESSKKPHPDTSRLSSNNTCDSLSPPPTLPRFSAAKGSTSTPETRDRPPTSDPPAPPARRATSRAPRRPCCASRRPCCTLHEAPGLRGSAPRLGGHAVKRPLGKKENVFPGTNSL